MRQGNWIQTYTGKQFWALDPRPEEVDIEDIAHSLSMLCRFNGHCKEFFSVAEHSTIMTKLLYTTNEKKWALLHDAAEAYITDIPKPIKNCLPEFKEIEDNILRAIATKFELEYPIPPQIKDADLLMLSTEREILLSEPPEPWRWLPEPVDTRIIQCLSPKEAKEEFMTVYKELF